MNASPHRADARPATVEDAPFDAGARRRAGFRRVTHGPSSASSRAAGGAGGRAVLGWALALLAALWIGYTAWSAGGPRRPAADLAGRSPNGSRSPPGRSRCSASPGSCSGAPGARKPSASPRSVIAMRTEARSLEGLLGVLSQRIDDNHAALNGIAKQLMELGDEATDAARRGHARPRARHRSGSPRMAWRSTGRPSAARIDIGVLLDDLPRAEASARRMAERCAAPAATRVSKAASSRPGRRADGAHARGR